MTKKITMQCPTCKGSGEITAFFVKYEDGSSHFCKELPCIDCEGTGRVDYVAARRKAAGRKLKDDRIADGLTLREAAKKLGVNSSLLSKVERGLVDPSVLS